MNLLQVGHLGENSFIERDNRIVLEKQFVQKIQVFESAKLDFRDFVVTQIQRLQLLHIFEVELPNDSEIAAISPELKQVGKFFADVSWQIPDFSVFAKLKSFDGGVDWRSEIKDFSVYFLIYSASVG